MGRPEKNTVDYIPLDCQFTDSIQAVETLYGNDGFVVWVKLLQKLGRTENYIIDVRDELHWSLFYPIFRIPENKLIDILNLLSSLDCINKELWKQHIIYSQNFVKRIGRVYRKRNYELKNINTILEEMGVFSPENLVSDTENFIFSPQNTQSKVKESKEKERKEDNKLSSSSLEEILNKISKEEEEELKKIAKENKKNYFRPWLRKIIDHGDIQELLQKAKARIERRKQKEISAAAEKIEEVQEDEETTKAAYEKFKKAGEELRKIK